MKPVIIASGDLSDGFRLAGIPVFELDEESQIPKIIKEILAMPDAGIVLVDERYIEKFEKAFEGRDLPMVASFPSEEVEREGSYIDELTLRYLGQKIYVEGEG
ncbi:V-type ATP synthase subunit F [Candidatus Acetothermia bacterium]|nr:V-type ATP synthase subunit F [Candidatus Acetothermia bacterium]MBI3643592.1 V-type ATP synthase subunit F [Candidatus Acetothermia bacterium]